MLSKKLQYLVVLSVMLWGLSMTLGVAAQPLGATQPSTSVGDPQLSKNARNALQTLNASIQRLVETGPAFEAKLRQVTRVDHQEVRAIGRYVTSSKSRGLMRMELQSSIDNQTSRFEQTCDGRLVWTREQIGDDIRIRRVDIGRLDELAFTIGIPVRFKVGGIPELLDSIARDFDLKLVRGKLKESQQVWIVRGTMKPQCIERMLDEHKLTEVPAQMPTQVRVALAADGPFELTPVRVEFSGDPDNGSPGPARLISEMDIYDLTPIQAPNEELFRYNTSEKDADFTNETQDYLDRFQNSSH